MSDIHIRKIGRTGRITLNRPDALNAVTFAMVNEIAAALPEWAADDEITMVVIDATGDRAFSAGGDLMGMYQFMCDGAYDKARQFWHDEYRMNALLFDFPKPVASFMQGFTMGGGVGVGCHGSHRVVGASSKIAMPECGIGLAPDVGGTLLLARAPGRLGEYLGTTGYRMGPEDAIHAGFADYYILEDVWPELISELENSGDWEAIDRAAAAPSPSTLADEKGIDRSFAGETFRDIVSALQHDSSEWAADTLKRMSNNAPLAMSATIELVHRARSRDQIDFALLNEYRFSYRIAAQGDFKEGIRAMIIDKDKTPKWTHDAIDGPSPLEVSQMLMPLGENEWTRGDQT